MQEERLAAELADVGPARQALGGHPHPPGCHWMRRSIRGDPAAERTPLTAALSLSSVQVADSGTFVYANPGTIHWGPGSLARCLAQELDERRVQRVFVITTKSVASNAALGGALAQLLGARSVGQYSAISQHAPAASVAAATQAAADAKPDLLISFGGGSPIDAA